MIELTDEEKKEIRNYYKKAINAGDYWKQELKEHEEHKNILTNRLSESSLNSMSENQLIDLLIYLYANRKRYNNASSIKTNILEPNNNNSQKIINWIKNLIYGKESLDIRIMNFRNNIKSIALSNISEMFNFVYPNKYPLWNSSIESALNRIKFDNLVSYINKGNSNKDSQKYERVIEVMTLIKNSIEDDENTKLSFIDIDILMDYISDLNEYISIDNKAETHFASGLKSRNFILNGPVGTGKTEFANILAKEIIENKINKISEIEELLKDFNKGGLNIEEYNNEKLKKITFHPSYGYEDFIIGLKAEIDEKNNIKYEYRSGIFKDFCDAAIKDPGNNYVMTIDEINRGDISRIFGELITLVEESKRGDKIALPYKDRKNFMEFIVPENLYIIGTMNDSDKSIALLDSALRRRFMFFRIDPSYDIVNKWYSNKIIQYTFKTINDNISKVKGPDYMIGHAFLKRESDDGNEMEDFMHTFKYKIIPLLQEYFYGDETGLVKVLGAAFNNHGRIKYDSFDNIDNFEKELNKIKVNTNGN